MRLRFTKMQGAGNDFVVLDATRAPIALSGERLRRLADRRFGIGCDQILMVGPSPAPGIDFSYRIFNGGSGDEVEHCGNGARCFMRYLHDKGLADKRVLRVRTMNATILLRLQDDGRVSVDMAAPVFEPARVPFDVGGLRPREMNGFPIWPVEVDGGTVELAVLSMGNPHAVQLVDDVDAAPVATLGPSIEAHPRFPRRVNAGFLQIVERGRVRLRVFERGAGETLACGTGACAAVVAGICLGLLDTRVDVETRGGTLTIEWDSGQTSVQSSDQRSGQTSDQRIGENGVPVSREPMSSGPTTGSATTGSLTSSSPSSSSPTSSGATTNTLVSSRPMGNPPMSRDRPVLMTGPAETVYEGEIEL